LPAPATGNTLSPTGRNPLDSQGVSDGQAAQARQNAREAGDVAAKLVSRAALWTFFVLLISGVVAMFAGGASASTGLHKFGHGWSSTPAHSH
jgi:hypothetical protein